MLGFVPGARLAPAGAEPVRAQRAEFENGLVLLHLRNPAALTVAVCCFVRVSARVETRETAGLRQLAQQTLLDLPDAQGRRLEQRLADHGLQGTVQTSPDYVEALFEGTADQLPELLGFVRETLSDTRPAPRQVSLRRAAAVRAVQERCELPLSLARDLAQAHLYQGTPCAWPAIGTPAVGTLTPEQLLAVRRMRYAPNRAVVAVAGNVDWGQCRRLAHEALADLLPRPVPEEPPLRRQPAEQHACLYSPWEGDNAVVLLATACPGPEREEFAAAAVLNAVLGSGEGSRLFEVLRRREGLTYSVLSDLTPSRLCGTITLSATCEPRRANEVLQLMQAEVAGLKSRPPTTAEVRRAQAYLTSSYVLGRQRNAEVAHYLGLFEVLLPGGRESDLAALLEAVTPEQVVQAAGWLQDRSVWVQVGGARP